MVGARAILAIAMAAVVAGCAAAGPDYRLPGEAVVNAPPAQGAFLSGGAATSVEPPPDHWWKLFDDPVLDGLIERALAANTDLRIAEANLERSDALLVEARTGRQVDGLADVETSWAQPSAEAVMQHVRPPEHQIYNAGISISYDLDLFGGIRRGIEAAGADSEAAIAARDLARVNITAETTRAYADVCNAGYQADVLRRVIAVQEEDLRLTRILIAHGRSPRYEQERQQGALESTRSRLPQLEARQRNGAYRLATLMGLPPARFDRKLLDCRSPLKLRALLPVGDGQTMLKRRPDVRAAERRLAAATARIGVATAALYPDIRLGASIGSTGAGADLLSPLTNRFGVGPMISWNLRRGTTRARIAQAEAQSRASLAAFDGTVLTALREAETALDNYAADLDRLAGLRAARDQAARVARQTRELQRGGRIGGLAALDAERALTAAEQAAAQAEADVNSDQIAVFLALGGGWA